MSRIRWITPIANGCLLLSLLLATGFVSGAQAATAEHLIISEVVALSRFDSRLGGQVGSEFIEITNPTASPIAMDDVYLTDGIYGPSNVFYWHITDGTPTSATIGGGAFGDFHVRFPAGYTLGAGEALVVSIAGSDEFFAAYDRLPDFELFEDNSVPDVVPELLAVFPGSVHGGQPVGETDTDLLPDLSDTAESLILYSWDGQSALVADLDYMYWGSVSAAANYQFDKTSVAGYNPDTPIANQEPVHDAIHILNDAFARVNTDEGLETTAGGNGIGGDDETSENLGTTWVADAAQDPAPAPVTHFATAPIITAANSGGSAPQEDAETVLTATADGYNDGVTGIDFHYAVDGGAEVVLTGVASKAGTWTADVPGQAEAAVVTWYAVATHANGSTATWPVLAPAYTESWTVAPPPSGAIVPHKLLITEVSAGDNIFPTFLGMQQIAMEFIEVHNPNTFTVDLSNYYLTDAINYAFSTQLYWFIANGSPAQDTVGGGNYNDFTARFPADYMLAPGQTVVVSIGGSSNFAEFFGFQPDIELYEDDAEPDGIPDMRPVFENSGDDPPGNSIYTPDRDPGSDGTPRGIPELEEHYGEPVIMYHWNEGDNLVTDIDIFMFGDAKTGDFRFGFDKTGLVVNGSAYGDDTPVLDQDWFSSLDESGTVSYGRIESDDAQHQTGSNGVGGRDETSEKLNLTFEVTPFSPGFYASGVQISIPAILRVPAKTFIPSQGEVFPIEFEGPLNSEIKLRLFDQQGRLVLTLFDSRFDSFLSGITNQVQWDGLDDTYQRVHAGMYILHMSVVDMATGEEQSKTAPVVLATRLSK